VLRSGEEFGARGGMGEAEGVFVVEQGGGGEAPERGRVERVHFGDEAVGEKVMGFVNGRAEVT